MSSIILTPRLVGTGAPVGQSLENIVVTPLQDGALCYVASGPAKGEWQLDKASVAIPDGTTIIAPIEGPGRWLRFLSGGGGGSPSVGTDVLNASNGAGGWNGSNITLIANVLGTIAGTPFQVISADAVSLTSTASSIALNADTTLSLSSTAATTLTSGSSSTLTAVTSISLTATTSFSVTGAFGSLTALTGNLSINAPAGIAELHGDVADIEGATAILLTVGAITWTWPSSDGSSGQVLTTNGAGGLSWTSAGGGGGPTIARLPITVAAGSGGQNEVIDLTVLGFTTEFLQIHVVVLVKSATGDQWAWWMGDTAVGKDSGGFWDSRPNFFGNQVGNANVGGTPGALLQGLGSPDNVRLDFGSVDVTQPELVGEIVLTITAVA